MKFRAARLADIPLLNQLVNGAYRGDSSRVGWTTEADLLDGIRTSEESLQKQLTTPDATILLAVEGEELLGCVYLEKQAEALYLGMLTVKPDRQGLGVGAGLLNAAEQHAKDVGCKKIRMTVITVREELIAYYVRKGYRDTGERQPFPNDPAFGLPKQPLSFLVMEKQLP